MNGLHISPPRRSRIASLVALATVAALVGLALATAFSRTAQGESGSGVIALAGAAEAFNEHWMEALDVRAASSIKDVRDQVRLGNAWGIAVSRENIANLDTADIRNWARSGLVIIGVAVPLDELVAMVRSAGGLADLDDATPPGALLPFEGVRTTAEGEQYFSFLVRTSADVVAKTGCSTLAAGNRRMDETTRLDVDQLRLVALARVKSEPGSPVSTLACR